MKQKLRRKSKRNNNRIVLLKKALLWAFVIVFIASIFSAVINLIKNPTNTVIVKKGSISKEETDVGYIIRDEIIVSGNNTENGMEQIIDESQKVAKDASVYRYYSEGEDGLIAKINELDEKIQKAMEENTGVLFSTETKLLDGEISNKLSRVNTLTSMQEIQEAKKSLYNDITKRAKIAGSLSPSGSLLRQLVEERNQYEDLLYKGSEYVVAPKSGIVSYRIDGLEDTLKVDDLSIYTKSYLDKLGLKTGQIIGTSTKQGKIINNFVCYIAATSKTPEALNAKEGDYIKVRLPSGKKVEGKIEKINKENDQEVTLVISISEGIEELSLYRKVSVDIIWWNSSGYKVPKTAIYEENKLHYVIKTRGGYLEKVLVRIVRETDDYAIVTSYSASAIKDLTISNNVKTTISLYDELVLEPSEDQKKSVNE